MSHRSRIVLCALAMAAVAALALLWAGISWTMIVVVALAAGCLAAMLYVWLIARRALKPVERAARGMAAETKPRGQRS